LKELVVTVPEGFAKDKKKITSFGEYKEEQCILDNEVDNDMNSNENNNEENNNNVNNNSVNNNNNNNNNNGNKKISQLPIVHVRILLCVYICIFK